ncbi:MAG: hypothetical protein ACHQF0_12685 [Chitinophagales bacterium]
MYIFQVKQKDRLKILSVFHLLIAIIFILDLSHIHHEETKDWIFSAVYFISSIFLFIVSLFQKRILQNLSRHLVLLLLESALILFGAIYFWSKGASLVAFSHGILAGVIILFWIYLKRRANGEMIIVSETNIILPGLSGDRIVEWKELTNVVKKYDLLTLDFKNNKLLQVEVINADGINEDEFKQFCRQQLAKE